MGDDNQRIEPEWYMPIIPMVLVNGADGIGTGWMTKIPNYNPREIVVNIRRMLAGQEPKDMVPWFKNFKGTVEPLDYQEYVVNGEISTLSDTKLEVTELPVRTWTNQYKEMLEGMLAGDEKMPARIQDYKDYNTDTTVKFILQMGEEKLREVERTTGLHTYFKLQTTMSTTSMVLFDHLGCLRKFETVGEILREFYSLRLVYYDKRKKYMEGLLGCEACKLSNQARFILEKCDGTLKVENKKKKVMINELATRGYDSDPVKAWKASLADAEEEAEESEETDSQESVGGKEKGPDYDYLLGMPMWNLTQEKKDEICRKRDEKQQELKKLQGTTKEELWETDLQNFSVKLDEVEANEKAEDAAKPDEGTGGGKGAKKGKGKKGAIKAEALPSAVGIRVVPRIADELKVKTAKAIAAKERKANKTEGKGGKPVKGEKEAKDEFDVMAEGQEGKGAKMKQSKLTFKPKAEPKPKRDVGNPWSDSEGSDVVGSEEEEVQPREKTAGRRATAKKTYQMDSSDPDDVEPKLDDIMTVNSDSDEQAVKQESEKDEFAVSDSGSDDFGSGLAKKLSVKKAVKKPAVKKPAKKLNAVSDLVDQKLPVKKPDSKKPSAPKKTATAATKKKLLSRDSSDQDERPASKKSKTVVNDSSESEFDAEEEVIKPRAGTGRAKPKANYILDETSDSDF